MPQDYFGAEIDLETRIQDTIDEYADKRRAAWKEDEKGARYLAIFDAVAIWLLHAAGELTLPASPGPLDPTTVNKLLDEPELRKELKEKVQIDVASTFSTGTDKMAERCLQLARNVLVESPGEPVLRFLRRLSRCYIAGFFPECVMLCRAVLENAVRERFANDASHHGTLSMRERLATAQKRGWLSEQGRAAAETVWARGNKAVHDDPLVVREVTDTLRSTLLALGELYSTRGA